MKPNGLSKMALVSNLTKKYIKGVQLILLILCNHHYCSYFSAWARAVDQIDDSYSRVS
jgi:hypothetical protein